MSHERLTQSVRRRLARNAAQGQVDEWIQLCEDWISNGHRLGQAMSPPIRTPAMEKVATLQPDPDTNLYPLPDDLLETRLVTFDSQGLKATAHYQPPNAFFQSVSSQGRPITYPVFTVMENKIRVASNLESLEGISGDIELLYYPVLTSIVGDPPNHPLFPKYFELYLQGTLCAGFQELRNFDNAAMAFQSFVGVAAAIIQTTSEMRAGSAPIRARLPSV